MKDIFSSRITAAALSGFVIYEILAMLAVFWPPAEPWLFTILVFVVLVVVWEDRVLAYFLLLAESLIGSVGAAMTLDVGDVTVNLRAITSGCVLVAFLPVIWKEWKTIHRATWVVMPFLWIVVAGMLWGWMRGHALSDVIDDASGYGYLLLLFPALVVVKDPRAPRLLFSLIAAASIWIVAKTLIVFVLILQIPEWGDVIYFWMRNTTKGFLTYYNGIDMFRVGIAAHVHLLFPLFWIFLALRNQIFSFRVTWWKWAVFGIVSSLLINFSRSLWVGAIIGTIVAMVFWLPEARRPQKSLLIIGTCLGLVGLSFLFVGVVTSTNRFEPYLLAQGRTELVVASTMEAASVSRLRLLFAMKPIIRRHPIIGNGFGTLVTFQTEDPRAIANGDRILTTYLVEWGIVGLWMKLGLLGIVAFYGWIGILIARAIRLFRIEASLPTQTIAAAFLATLVGMIGVDFLTHYLNESVFLIWLVTMAALIEAIRGGASLSRVGASG
jgi:hypothetical protein